MYDNLVKRLWECTSGECFNCSQYTPTTNASVCQKELMKQAADAIEELQTYADLYENLTEESQRVARKVIDSYPKWIPVTERLPSEGTNVLVYEFGSVEQAYTTTYTVDRSLCWVVNGVSYHRISGADCPIKWWMPLPSPPKESEKDVCALPNL